MTSKLTVLIEGKDSLAVELRNQLAMADSIQLVTLNEVITQTVNIDAVVETTNSDLERKKVNLREIERYLGSDALILSSVLGVTATQTASWLSHPHRLVGFATFPPLNKAELIEIAPALQTDPVYLNRAGELLLALGKQSEVVDDEVGLVFPRILSMIINEAAFALMEGTASAADIDTAMRKGTNYPLGPLAWADEIGIDEVFTVLSALHRDLGEDRYRPAPILRKMVHAGWLGKKSGKGFYAYAKDDGKAVAGRSHWGIL